MVAGTSNVPTEEEDFIFPASFAQQRLWFIEQLVPEASLYTVPLTFRLTGSLHRLALEQSIQAIVCRHESLRTTFDVIEGQLVQVISPGLQVSLPLVDLRSLPEAEREQVALAQMRQEMQQPFDLNQGPLLRVQLWQLAETDHLLLIALHHIVFDEWSSGVLIRELGALYAAIVDRQSVTLPELPIQYADFAHWQRQWLQGDALQAQLSYWRQQLKEVPHLDLPGAASRPAMQTHRGASQLLEFPQQLLDALEDLSQRSGVTLFMTLLAAFQTLLYRYTGQTDIAVGSPIANRHRSELEGLIGFLVNSLVLRTDLADDPPFWELLHRVRDVTLAAYAHQDLPFEKLVEELQPVRSLSQNPLFQVVFALQNTPMEQLELPDLTLSPIEFETKTTRFDLELYLWKSADNFRSLWGTGWQQSDGLRGVVVYNTDLFGAGAIASLRRHFQTLLEGIVANPNTRLSTLPLLTAAEQQQMLHQWSQMQTERPTACIHELFEAQVRQRPQAIAVQFADRQFTYQALNQGSNQLARYLQKLGMTAETLVGICLERSAETIAAMLAVLKAGGAYVPLDPELPPDRLRLLLEDAQINVVLTHKSWADSLQSDTLQIVSLEQNWTAIAQESEENLSCSCSADQLAYVMYTSGSTGTPKGVMVPHRAVTQLVCQTDYVKIEPDDRLAQVANLAFDASTFEVWGALLNGAQLIGIERETTLSPSEFVDQLRQQQITHMFLTTALFNQTVSQIPDAFRSLNYLLFGGEMANLDRVRAVLAQGKPQHLIHVYGPTENTTFSTWYEVEELPAHATTLPIGRAIANTQVYVLDANLQPVPAGVRGEIYLSGDGLARGYLNRAELTANRFISSPFDSGLAASKLYRTGDHARYQANGDLEFLGRSDNQIKLRGFRVELGEIEAVLVQHPEVQTAVVSLREVGADRQLIAYVVCARSLSDRDLRAFLKTKLPAYMLPAAFVKMDTLPLTANGKIDRRALPLPSITFEPLEPNMISAAPTTSLEKALIDIWSHLLGRQAIGIHDNFFELGGHSLLATQLVSRLRDRLQVEVSLRTVFEAPTIAQLAQQVASQTEQKLSDALNQREEVEF
ncbi:amino acid adenylation domain-containing protein [Phormidium tenue FACHB-886]|nr:amino acid adenylation domain-containing protein [Phormidium tenue FACHB-886]